MPPQSKQEIEMEEMEIKKEKDDLSFLRTVHYMPLKKYFDGLPEGEEKADIGKKINKFTVDFNSRLKKVIERECQ
jgi:hypothetical protein